MFVYLLIEYSFFQKSYCFTMAHNYNYIYFYITCVVNVYLSIIFAIFSYLFDLMNIIYIILYFFTIFCFLFNYLLTSLIYTYYFVAIYVCCVLYVCVHLSNSSHNIIIYALFRWLERQKWYATLHAARRAIFVRRLLF